MAGIKRHYVHHNILLKSTNVTFGLFGSFMEWIDSFLHGRTFSVVHSLTIGLGGSSFCMLCLRALLGPLLYSIHTSGGVWPRWGSLYSLQRTTPWASCSHSSEEGSDVKTVPIDRTGSGAPLSSFLEETHLWMNEWMNEDGRRRARRAIDLE